jgi:pyrroloquinoline-quinone synthase
MPTRPATGLEQRIREVIERRSLLDHPFFRDWCNGELSRPRLEEFARQFYHFEANFSRFLSAIHARTDSLEVRQLLLENLWDEEYGPRNHAVLWLEFSDALGLRRSDVTGATLRPETVALIEHYRQQSEHASVAEAMGTLFAYEGQVPAVAWETIKGLKERYGFTPDQFEFFSVHLVADIGHADAEIKAIEELASDPDPVVAAIEAGCDRLYAFLDGCYAAG